MSEYQYHEWQTVDRVLTPEEQEAVNSLSSHIGVTPSRAEVTYHWSNFRHDPKQVLLKFFDAYFYMANWGTLILMFRFPHGTLDPKQVAPYCLGELMTLESKGQYQVLSLELDSDEGGEGWMEAEGGLSLFIPLRADLMEGDYRLLYLAWLKAAMWNGGPDAEDGNDEEGEPPVPPGLLKLSPALTNFCRVFEIDPHLVQAAAERSSALEVTPAVDYRELAGRLRREECDEWLARVAGGEPGVAAALRTRLRIMLPRNYQQSQTDSPRTIRQLSNRARQLAEADNERKAEAARRKHIADMHALAARKAQTWKQVDTMLATGSKSASTYDQATALLEGLEQLAEFQNSRKTFEEQLGKLVRKYATRPSLMERWKHRGWVRE